MLNFIISAIFIASAFFYNSATCYVNGVTEHWYTQPLDHFVFKGEPSNETTFQQRVYLDHSYRDGRPDEDGMPILVYLGGQANVELSVGSGGILTMAASQWRGLVVYIEHRFYGQSVPLGSIKAAMMDPYIRGCLTTHQALADFANIIPRLKYDHSIQHSPVIVFGGSYSGSKMKSPQIVDGALASSAPIFSSLDLAPEHQYCSVVSRDFRDVNEKCYTYIALSWIMIDQVVAQAGGLDLLSLIFDTCRPLSSVFELKDYLTQVYFYAAQYNGRFGQISRLCSIITQATQDNILQQIKHAVFSFIQTESCINVSRIDTQLPFSVLDSTSQQAWDWQVCSELVPRQSCTGFTMFEKSPFNLSLFISSCYQQYGVYPNPNWIPTYYGGQASLRTSSSNIIFSNGLMDPYSIASVLEDISKTVVAVTTKEGSHCLDLGMPKDDDPKWLKHQREKELRIISHWIKSARSPSSRLLGRHKYVMFIVLLAIDFLVLGSI